MIYMATFCSKRESREKNNCRLSEEFQETRAMKLPGNFGLAPDRTTPVSNGLRPLMSMRERERERERTGLVKIPIVWYSRPAHCLPDLWSLLSTNSGRPTNEMNQDKTEPVLNAIRYSCQQLSPRGGTCQQNSRRASFRGTCFHDAGDRLGTYWGRATLCPGIPWTRIR